MKNLFADIKNIIKEDKKVLFFITLAFIFVVTGGVMALSFKPYDVDRDGIIDSYDYWLLSQGQKYISNNSIKKLPQRIFTLDMQGLSIDSATGDTDSKLKEYNSSSKKIAEWKVDIEKKGHFRSSCNPPMFNMTFDKFDSAGNPRPLFPGISTFGTNTVLNYQKIRAVENCDAPGDSLNNYPSYGLSGALPPQFREYIIYRTMRLLGVPSVEPVAFAKLNILNAEAKYSNSDYYYMFMQRDNELDDQIPFVRQFGLEDKLYQDGVFDWSAYYGPSYDYSEDRLVKVDLMNNQTNEPVQLSFNSEDSIRHFLLTRLIYDTDRGALHNEDYGKIAGSDKYKTILYGFDFSFNSCRAKTLDDLNFYINNIGANLQPEWKAAYYKVAREMFTDNNNLFKILLAIDQYPNPVSSRSVIVAKKYMKLSFYEYGKYFNSKEFADSLGQPYVPIKFIPIMNDTTYNISRVDFDTNWCKQELLPAPNFNLNITPGEITYIKSSDDSDDYIFEARFDLKMKATDSDISVPKVNAFKGVFVRDGVEADSYTNIINQSKEFIDFGSYYLLRRGDEGNITLLLRYYFDGQYSRGHSFYAYVKTFRPGSDYNFVILPVVKTKKILFDEIPIACQNDQSISDVNVITENQEKFRTFDVKWNSNNVSTYDIVLMDENKNIVKNIISNYTPTGPNSEFKFENDGTISSGNYYVRIYSHCDKNVYSDSELFSVVDYKNVSLKITNFNNIRVSLEFDNLNQEVSLDSKEDIDVEAIGGDVFFDQNNLGYIMYSRLDNLEKYPQSNDYVEMNIVDALGFELSDNGHKYVLREGETGKFKVVTKRLVNRMFPGTYSLKLVRFFGFNNNDNYVEAQVLNPEPSNSVVIIGEKSPYLFQTRKEPYSLTDNIEIVGERLNLVDRLKITKSGDGNNPKIINLTYLGLNNNKFKIDPAQLKLDSGNYQLQIISKKGESNSVGISLINSEPVAKKVFNLMANVWQAFTSFFDVKK